VTTPVRIYLVNIPGPSSRMVQRIVSARKQQIPYGNDSKKCKSKNESATVSMKMTARNAKARTKALQYP
jgi:hypothetical protein